MRAALATPVLEDPVPLDPAVVSLLVLVAVYQPDLVVACQLVQVVVCLPVLVVVCQLVLVADYPLVLVVACLPVLVAACQLDPEVVCQLVLVVDAQMVPVTGETQTVNNISLLQKKVPHIPEAYKESKRVRKALMGTIMGTSKKRA